MGACIGDKIEKTRFTAYSNGEIKEVDISACKNKLVVLVFYPRDFTFVCPTEILGFSKDQDLFSQEKASIFLISCDSVYSHQGWMCTNAPGNISENTLPLLSDAGGALSSELGIYIAGEGRSKRATIILDEGRIIYKLIHADPIGRSSSETLRVV
ncbi:peroxiredoxin 2/4, partial [Nematocida major]|uniref:peroxiredoxin 2/4 n=1 Tax=Nematocida major TaxID=1912982 RepID=UPI002008E5B9